MNVNTIHVEEPIAVVDLLRAPEGMRSPAQFGKQELLNSMSQRDLSVTHIDHWTQADGSLCLVVGTISEPRIQRLLDVADANVPSEPEGVVYQWCEPQQTPKLIIAGTDERGLMYALLELADRIADGGANALGAVGNQIELPDNRVRGIDRFLTGPVEDEWFYSEEFWHSYLSRLARCRFNRFVLVTGYDTTFMSPPYPFFVDVPEYPEVRVADEIDATQEEHLTQLRTIGRLCQQYGLEFVFGIWQQQPWETNPDMNLADRLTTKYADPDADFRAVVEGLPTDAAEFTDYCTSGLHALLMECPEIDGVQFRVNYESGFGDRNTAEEFWYEIIAAVGAASEEREHDIELDLRAKGLTDDMIQRTLETGLNLAVPTKYWCESTGLPYHTTQMREKELANLDDPNNRRRYGYADLLEKPRWFDVLYRLWVMGTNRVFVWGDPDYARRFAESTQFGDAAGFEITAPLTLKGGHYSLQEEKWPLFDDPDLRHYEWEDDRYWAWYLLFGRLGYSTDTDSDVWEREFRAHFGDAAEPVQEAYRTASKVLPLVTAFHLTRHPGTVNWAEMDTGGALFAEHNFNEAFEDVTYLTAEPSDPGLFYAIDEYVQDYLDDNLRGKYTPMQVSRWLERLATSTRNALATAEKTLPDPDAEFHATALDLRMLADLADYHARKTHAAIELCLYQHTKQPNNLKDARVQMGHAMAAWESLAERGEGTYHDDLLFVRGAATADTGQWKDRLVEMESDLEELDRLLDESTTSPVDEEGTPTEVEEDRLVDRQSFDISVADEWVAGESLELTVQAGDLNRFNDLVLRYRHANQTEGEFRAVSMERTDRGYRAAIPGEYIVSEWDLQVYFSTVDDAGNGVIIPGLFSAECPYPYYVIEVSSS